MLSTVETVVLAGRIQGCLADPCLIMLVGINFSSLEKTVDDWLAEPLTTAS